MYGALRLPVVFDADHPVPQRRLEDRIQDLAGKAVAAHDPEELADVLRQLRAALREHADRLRKLAAEKLIAIPKKNSGTDDMAAG